MEVSFTGISSFSQTTDEGAIYNPQSFVSFLNGIPSFSQTTDEGTIYSPQSFVSFLNGIPTVGFSQDRIVAYLAVVDGKLCHIGGQCLGVNKLTS